MRRLVVLLATLALLFTSVSAVAVAAPSQASVWIVQLRGDAGSGPTPRTLARQHGGSVGFVYRHALNGFSFRGSAAAAAALSRNPHVATVEADAEVWLDTTQSNATWGLDRIDQRTLPLNEKYVYERTGAGVTAYVIDSGIFFGHAEFGGRAIAGADFVGDEQMGNDCNGHGTHVAGTIGGSTYGVAKGVTLISVRVFGCTGGSTWETIIAGIDWAAWHHVHKSTTPAVANMSLSGGGSSAVDTATNNLINVGVATAVAAGNGNFIGRQADACKYSPARVPAAMTISATDSSDRKASWANYGSCVDWFAPGVNITSAWYTPTSATNTISGTSMASPHAAGVAALYLEANPGALPSVVRDAIFAETTKGVVTSSSTANNHMLYSGFIPGGSGGGGGDGETAPTADFSATTTSGTVPLTVQFTDTSTGAPTSWSWNFGGGGTSTLQQPSHTYTAAGTYTVTLTATNATGSDIETKTNFITVNPAPAGDLQLSVLAYKTKGERYADLTWSTSDNTGTVDVYRNGAIVITTPNDGSHTDPIDGRGGGTFTYRVCLTTTTTCSADVTASF